MTMRLHHAALAGLALAACGGGSAVGELRFHNAAPVTVVDDRRDVPAQPEKIRFLKSFYHFDGFWHRSMTRAMEVRPPLRAQNVNALDEVPDSTWFTNRIGVRDLSLDELAVGPNVSGDPEDHRPWTIVQSKSGGVSPGFLIEDARGERYLLKFDLKGVPEMETGADIIVQRILWAVGYNVPEDYVVQFHRDDLVLAPDAVKVDPLGNEEPLTEAFVERELERTNMKPDGSLRGLASKFLPGEPLGPFPREGVRKDDPNDLVPHQLRRDLRGQYAFFSWLDHTDIKGDNTLDMYTEDPADPDRHYVVHYLLDFGKALGVQASMGRMAYVGYAYTVDLYQMSRSLLTLGLWQRTWEERVVPGIEGVGLFGAKHYDPGSWRPYTPSYFPIHDADRFDNFWASKILIRFTPRQLRRIVELGRFSDPRAVDYITRVLIQRQRMTAGYWFRQVNPLDEFRLRREGDGYALCFVDLALRHNLEHSLVAPTRYDLVGYDGAGERSGYRQAVRGTVDGEVCATGLTPAAGEDGYTVVKIETFRERLNVPGTLVHMAQHPQTGELRVIGLRRL